MYKVISIEKIENRISQIRGKRIMLDRDLAKLYGVKSIALRQQVKETRKGSQKILCFSLHKKKPKLWYHKT